MSRPRSGAPSLSAAGATSSRSQSDDRFRHGAAQRRRRRYRDLRQVRQDHALDDDRVHRAAFPGPSKQRQGLEYCKFRQTYLAGGRRRRRGRGGARTIRERRVSFLRGRKLLGNRARRRRPRRCSRWMRWNDLERQGTCGLDGLRRPRGGVFRHREAGAAQQHGEDESLHTIDSRRNGNPCSPAVKAKDTQTWF